MEAVGDRFDFHGAPVIGWKGDLGSHCLSRALSGERVDITEVGRAVARAGDAQDDLGAAEPDGRVVRLERLGNRFESLFGHVLDKVVERGLVSSAGLVERKLEGGMFAAPLVDGGAMNSIVPGGAGDRFSGKEAGKNLGLDGCERDHTGPFTREDLMGDKIADLRSLAKSLI